MKARLVLMVFCVLVFVTTSLAQQHDWVSVDTATSSLFRDRLDRNFNVLPSGNIEYWVERTVNGYVNVGLYEVNCLKKERRQLKALKDGYVVEDTPDSYFSSFDGSRSSNGQVAAMVCRMAKPPVVEKRTVRTKVVRKTRKRKP
jgi:hypothetical protein